MTYYNSLYRERYLTNDIFKINMYIFSLRGNNNNEDKYYHD